LEDKNATSNISNTAELRTILDELRTLYTSLNPKSMTEEQFNQTVVKAKEFVQAFREKANTLIPAGQKSAVKKRIADYELKQKAKIDDLKKGEKKARMLYNGLQFEKSLKEIIIDAKEFMKDGKKLLEVQSRLKNLSQLKLEYRNESFNVTDLDKLKNRWKEEIHNYGLDKNISLIKNERAQLAIGLARVSKSIREAKSLGQDTTELENQLTELKKQLEQFVPGKIISADTRAKAAVIRTRIANMEKNPKIVDKLEKLKELRQEEKQVRKEIRNDSKKEIKSKNMPRGD
jgi:hypothetical protein